MITLLKQSRNDAAIVTIVITVITTVTVMTVILNTKTNKQNHFNKENDKNAFLLQVDRMHAFRLSSFQGEKTKEAISRSLSRCCYE